MESTVLGIVLDSSTVIAAERKKLDIADFIGEILQAHGCGSIAFAGDGGRTRAWGFPRQDFRGHRGAARPISKELIALIPVHPITARTGWLAGQIEGQEAAKGNVVPFSELLIAVGAIERGYAVLTSNIRHFKKVPGVTVLAF